MDPWKAESLTEIAKEAVLEEIKSRVKAQLLSSIDGIIEDAVNNLTKDITVTAQLERIASTAGVSDCMDICIRNTIDKG